MKYFPYFYQIKVDQVLDGDTIDAVFDLGFNISHKVRVRLAGYDAPETFRPKNAAELEAGVHTKGQLIVQLNRHGQLYCRSTKIDLYGRSTGIIYFKDEKGNYVSINDLMARWIVDVHYTKEELRK